MRVDLHAALELHAEVEDVADLLVDDFLGQAEARDLRPDHAAGARVLVEHRDLVAERREVARHGERGGPGADAGDALAVLLRRGLGHARLHVVALRSAATRFRRQIATGSGLALVLFLDAAAAARGLAGTVAGAPEDAGEHVRLPVDHVGVAVAACGDQADVFGNRGMGRTRPLAIDDFVEVVGVLRIRSAATLLSLRLFLLVTCWYNARWRRSLLRARQERKVLVFKILGGFGGGLRRFPESRPRGRRRGCPARGTAPRSG